MVNIVGLHILCNAQVIDPVDHLYKVLILCVPELIYECDVGIFQPVFVLLTQRPFGMWEHALYVVGTKIIENTLQRRNRYLVLAAVHPQLLLHL